MTATRHPSSVVSDGYDSVPLFRFSLFFFVAIGVEVESLGRGRFGLGFGVEVESFRQRETRVGVSGSFEG